MVAGGDTQSNQTSVQLEEHVYTALWSMVSPEGLLDFQRGQ